VNVFLKSGIALFVGIFMSGMAIFVGTQALSPAAEQSNAPLIDYGAE